MSQPLQYGYLNFQGRGQIARLLLVYTKTPYKETSYSFTKMNEWIQKDKQTLGLDFPSMPYLIDGKLRLTESRAIEKYIIHRAKRTDMLGKNNKQKAFIDNIDGVLRDIFSGLVGLLSVSNFDEGRNKLFESAQQKLNYLNSCIGGKNHLLTRLTYVDFILNVVFGYFRFFYPHEYNRWQNIERVFQNINKLHQIEAYYNSPEGVSALLAPEWASNPKYSNIKPLFEEKSQQIPADIPLVQPPQEVRPEPMIVIVNQQTVQTDLSLKEDKDAPVIRKIESVEEPKQFNQRVSSYIKAVQTTNQKTASQIKQGIQNSFIVTPSRLQSSIKTSGNLSALWKVKNQQKINTEQPGEISSIFLGYWGIRGLGQVQRHLLTYCGHEFSEKIYKTREEWFSSDKLYLNIPFPNLPYLISGDFKITQSLAIDRFIIRTSQKHELLGKNLKDETYIQNFVKILSELFTEIRVLCFTQDQEKKKTSVLAKLNLNFPKFDQFIENHNLMFGYLTWVDFYIAEISYYIEKIFPQVYISYAFLRKIRESINQNEEIQQYYTKTGSVAAPFMPPSAKISF